MIRKLFLVNSEAETYDLNRRNISTLVNPKGLGYFNKIKKINVEGNIFISDIEVDYPPISGDIVFSGYAEYDNFIAFIERHDASEPLILKYQPNTEAWFTLVEVNGIGKTERSRSGYLISPVSFLRRTRFFQENEIVIDIDIGDIISGKRYSYDYGYTYFNDNAAEVEIEITSQQEVAVLFTISGDTLNPNLQQIIDNIIVAEIDITEATSGLETIIIDSNLIPNQKIVKDDGVGNETSLYNPANVDFNKQIFITLKKGINTILFTNDLTSGSLRIVYRLERVSV